MPADPEPSSRTRAPRSAVDPAGDLEAIRGSEARLRSILEHGTNLFYAHTPDHVFTYVSPQVRTFFDCEPDEALVPWTTFLSDNPANAEAVRLTQLAIETGERQPRYEVECVSRKGRRLWVEVDEAPVVRDGKTVLVVGAAIDITERKRTEEALRKHVSFNDNVLRAQSDLGVGFVLAAHDRLLYVNDALCEMTGYGRGELLSLSSVLPLVAPDCLADIQARLQAALAGTPRPDTRFESAMIHKRGHRVEIDIAVKRLEDRTSLAVISDITARKEQERLLRQAEKMTALGRLVAGVAHELNNPLAVLRSNTAVALEALARAEPAVVPDALRKDLEQVLEANARAVRRMESLARRLQGLAAPQAPRLQSMDLAPVLRETADIVQAQFRERLTIEVDVPELPPVLCDGDLVAHLLANLLVNAAEAVSDGGHVRLAARHERGALVVTVEDDGVGFALDPIERAFEPFVTTKPRGNLGLGLTLARSVATDHGGTLTAADRPGGGAVLTFTIPLEEPS